jgi:RNA polymerase sigma-70 factor, ECF subfamily
MTDDLVDQIALARRGDRDAFGALFRAYQAPLLRYLAARRIGEPADVAGQVWIDVAGSIARFRGDADDFRRWLFTIAHRRSVDAVRASVRQAAAFESLSVSSPVAAGADDAYETATSLGRAIEMLHGLPADMAEAVALRVIGELPFADVAEVMGIAEGNARVLAHRGLKKLSERLAVTNPDSRTMERSS